MARYYTGDSFLRTDLEEKLRSLDITNLVICGYASEFCIDNTTRRATGLGYTVQLVSDAHTTHEKKHLSAKKIREHHNLTLSMGPTITAVQSEDIRIGHRLLPSAWDSCICLVHSTLPRWAPGPRIPSSCYRHFSWLGLCCWFFFNRYSKHSVSTTG